MYLVNTVAKEILFHFVSHQDFCRNCRKANNWYDDNLYVEKNPSWINVPLFFGYTEMNIFDQNCYKFFL